MKGIRNTSTNASTVSIDAYQIITDRILAKMEGGEMPWQKPWHSLGAPRNYATGHTYTGINTFLLHFLNNGLPLFLTFCQAQQLGGHVRQGAKGFPIIYYNVVEKETAEGETERIPFVKYSTVFNIADVEGLEVIIPEGSAVKQEPITRAEAIVMSWNDRPRIMHMDQQAYYVPAMDYVNMPSFSSFRNAEQYYQTLFHELTHATGHCNRLNRPDLAENMVVKGAEGYAREELTAEMGAAFLCGAAGISPEATDGNTAAYLQFWLGRLKADKTLLIKAASHAQKAVNLVLGLNSSIPV
ncbi:ArdC family protein [Hymenobacter sp. GOD-10R]|uniref:ArdC family protein n=1 Tax=Hymenobacter sp. GOD-10R TaxID=3093922 RepID=UPI002D774285|nr:zincin-like metallopeptidase domain-containing protein [Hymenobacter sp. GOD-10R]WRQ31603.1 zincin-like metallopeptidase domain-containing protein [Hymenobacter sp. GOD-10R]